MTTIMIADFSGMNPLRDGLLLPDNNAQYADNCFLYRGQVRGFRKALAVYTAVYPVGPPSGTQQIFRIPKDPNVPLDFSAAGSYWLEFPDPYMSVIRNPVVGDTWNRYYFFPSDQYNSSGANPAWPATKPPPTYNTLTRIAAGQGGYPLGIPIPTGGPPTVTPPSTGTTLAATVAVPPGGTVLTFATAAGVVAGMTAQDITTTTAQASTSAATAVGATVLTFPSTTGILVGMSVSGVNNPASIFAGSAVSAVTPTTVTISIPAQMAINVGDQIKFQNTLSIPAGTTVSTVTATQVVLSAGVVSAGVLVNDHIQFQAAQVETRAYLYTYVSQFNEEGPPSPATVATGSAAGTWVITIPPPPAADASGLALEWYRLYRTVTDSSGNATYYQVTQVPINFSGVTTINDSADDGTITANKALDTIGYTPPPAGLQGVVMMANGIAAGFTGADRREVWFSAPYLPHAWPANYALTVDYPIVGLTANGTSLNIMTEGSPFIATGVTPDTMTIGKITANEPCISRGSIVSSGEGAYYASPNGIQLLNTGGTENITQYIYEKEFHNSLLPPQWASGKYGLTYAAFVKGAPQAGDHNGFVIDHTDGNVPFSYMHFTHNVVNMDTDELSGQLFYLNDQGAVMQWNPPIPMPDTSQLWDWEWKSKQFRFPHPQEFKALLALFEVPPEVTFTPGVRNTDQAQVFDPTTQWLTVTVFADGRQVVIREIQTSGEVLLIPGGFKATIWEFYFHGIVALKHFRAASSVKELKAA